MLAAFWGTILDDMWTLEERDYDGVPDPEAEKWVRGFDLAWKRSGVPLNEAKCTDEGDEFQGTVLHSQRRWLGCSIERRWTHLCATLAFLGRPKVYAKTLERIIGKGSYIESFRPCLRSMRQECYWQAADLRGTRGQVEPTPGTWGELLVTAVLFPLAQHALDEP